MKIGDLVRVSKETLAKHAMTLLCDDWSHKVGIVRHTEQVLIRGLNSTMYTVYWDDEYPDSLEYPNSIELVKEE